MGKGARARGERGDVKELKTVTGGGRVPGDPLGDVEELEAVVGGSGN